MKIKFNEWSEIKDLVSIAFVNGLVLFTCFVASSFNDILYLSICTVSIGCYYIFLLKKCNIVRIVKYQIVLLIMSMFFLDVMFYIFRRNIPYELYYISEGISIVLLIKMGLERKNYKNVMKDSFMLLILGIVVSSLAITIINEANMGSYVNTLRVLLRYLPVYIVLSTNKADFKKMYLILYLCNILIFMAEWAAGMYQDFRNGIFGFVGGSCFQIFIMLYLVYVLIRYLYKQTSIWHLGAVFLLNVAFLIIAESKASIVMVVIVCVMIAMMVDTKLIKKVVIAVICVVAMFAGIQVLAMIYPEFEQMTDIANIGNYIESYIFGNSNPNYYKMGRFEAMSFICDQEQTSRFTKMFGLGLGEAMPQERWFHIGNAWSYQEVFDFPASTIYAKYGSTFGYHTSVLSWIRIGTGYVGVAVAIIVILCIMYKSIYLLSKGQSLDEKTMGGIGLFIAVMGIYTNGYSGGVLNTGYVLSVMVLLGMMQYHYVACCNRNKNNSRKKKNERIG